MDDLSNQLDWYKDEWQLMSDELDQARDDLQESDEERIHLRNKVADLTDTMTTIRDDLANEYTSANHRIGNRLVALSNLIDEYDRIFWKYVRLTNTKLITTEINNLRKTGGYPPL